MALTREAASQLVASVPHWHHKFEVFPGLVTPGSYDPAFLWNKLRLDGRCAGRRILDIGASDGFFTRRISGLGGDVLAVDYRAKASHGFGVMEKLSGREYRYEHANLFDLDTERLGRFDVVLFLGVLYHLPDMMRALHKLRSLCSGTLFIETHSDNAFCPGFPAARYFKSEALAGDFTNFWSPNADCVLDMLHDAGFDPVRHETWTDRFFAEAAVSNDPARLHKMNVAYGRIGSATAREPVVPATTPAVAAPPVAAPPVAEAVAAPASAAAAGPYGKPPAQLPPLAECGFYQTMDIPGHGVQVGQWDLRPGIEDYLGHVDFRGRRVLEVGTANGFVCFEMEKRGADVVGLDLPDGLAYDAPPYGAGALHPDAYRDGLRRLRNAWWLAHAALGSRAQMAYGHANRLSPALGRFGIGVLANVMQHLQDPIGALQGLAAICDEAVIVTEADWMKGMNDDLVGMISFDRDDPYVWYQVKPLLVESVLRRMGFLHITRTEHTQVVVGRPGASADGTAGEAVDGHPPHYTIVARRAA